MQYWDTYLVNLVAFDRSIATVMDNPQSRQAFLGPIWVVSNTQIAVLWHVSGNGGTFVVVIDVMNDHACFKCLSAHRAQSVLA